MVASEAFLETLNEEQISGLTDAHEKAVSLLGVASSLLSMMGSAVIIGLVIVRKNPTPYRRLMLATACADLISSVGWSLSPFLVPSDKSQYVWSVGNDATCGFLGTLTQFSFSAHWYSGILSFYFLLTVRYGVKPERMVPWEPWVHGWVWLWSGSTAIVGAAIGLYGPLELGPGCWVKQWPEGCGYDNDLEACKSPLLAWIFGGIPSMTMLLSIIINNLMIYCFVRSTVLRGYRHSSVHAIRGSSLDASAPSRASCDAVMASQLERVQKVGTQSFLYVAAFLVSYSWSYAIRILESVDFPAGNTGVVLPLVLLQAIFAPLQGFFNAIIFVRPEYLRVRTQFPKETRSWSLKRATFSRRIPPKHPKSVRHLQLFASTTNHAATSLPHDDSRVLPLGPTTTSRVSGFRSGAEPGVECAVANVSHDGSGEGTEEEPPDRVEESERTPDA